MPPRKKEDRSVIVPNLGLYLGIPPLAVPERALKDGQNFRIKQGKLTNLNLGWVEFGVFSPLNGPVTLIDSFIMRSGTETLILGTLTDLYKFNPGPETVSFITPIYATGTVDVSGATPAVVTAATGSPTWITNGIKAGDEIHFGSATQVDPTATWYVVASVDSETQLTLETAVAGAPLSGSTYTIRKLFTGGLTNYWDSGVFVDADPDNEDIWLGTNGIDDVVKWNGTDAQVTVLSGLGFKAKRLTVFGNLVIYANLTQGGEDKPTDIVSSDAGQPEDVSTGLATQLRVHGGTDEIEHLGVLGDNLVIYSERHIILGQFIGDPEIWAFREALTGYGPITGRLVADFGDYHEFIGSDSQYRFDGTNVERINDHLFREVLRSRDPSRRMQAFHHIDEENGDCNWVLPLTSDAGAGTAGTTMETAYNEHYLEDVGRSPTPFSKRTFPFTTSGYYERQATLTWDELSDTWSDYDFRWSDQFFFVAFPLNLVGDIAGNVWELGGSTNAATAALDSYVHFGRRVMTDSRRRGLLARIYPFATNFPSASYTLDVTPYLSDHASGVATSGGTDTYDLTQPEGGHFTTPYKRGRFFEVRFGTPGPSEPWELEGYDVEIRPGGKR